MKKLVILSAVLLLAAIILPSGTASGNYNVSKPTVADGNPRPPLIPPGSGSRFTPSAILVADSNPFPPDPSLTLVADGGPMPPFPPNPSLTLVADGGPMPPFPPNPSLTLVADGGPMPPFPPNPSSQLSV